jgi:hypothetical protein
VKGRLGSRNHFRDFHLHPISRRRHSRLRRNWWTPKLLSIRRQ